ncbi:hypothetical protein E2C01_018010 [Portunus trituberculatus]|uniref:Uncharacterized protein n=1 Tax=Portunus trituberculatus TaxID=210409 RepID=A0A5B7DV22_PORTR|nr:hypothetical protein [Portunus trituberculatus]
MHLLAACNLSAYLLDLVEQLFEAVHMMLNDTCRDLTYVITNLRAWRREAYLGRLRPSFSQDRLQEALQSSKSNADRMLHEAALRALARPHPALGLVERGPWPSTTTAVRPSATPTQRPPIAVCARDSRALTLLVPVGKDVDRRTSPFRSDNLPYRGAVAGCLAHRWEWLKIGAET